MSTLEKRLLELTKTGVSYFKFDGLFGHLYQRDYELTGRGAPIMPQLNTENLKPGDPALNNSIYDELKTYYLVAGTERLLRIFEKMDEINPDVFITVSNGAYLSPWWLQHADVVWMINAGDAAGGSNRNEELTYRDGVYHDIWKKENTKFPMNAIFNHEPKKTKSGEKPEDFKKYLLMNFSRGTGFLELYLKTENLNKEDWDVLAASLKWAEYVFPTFKNVHMHGGDPNLNEAYGYTAWDTQHGYISIHNPADIPITYSLTLNKHIGIDKNDNIYKISTPLADKNAAFQDTYSYGDTLNITMNPKEIIVINLSTKKLNWDQLLDSSQKPVSSH